MISPVVQAVLDAALAWVVSPDDDASATATLVRAVAVYRATLTPTCPECDGRGSWTSIVDVPVWSTVRNPCLACGGSGVTPNPQEDRIIARIHAEHYQLCNCLDYAAQCCVVDCPCKAAAAPSTEPAP